jgi:hypothetical protein
MLGIFVFFLFANRKIDRNWREMGMVEQLGASRKNIDRKLCMYSL